MTETRPLEATCYHAAPGFLRELLSELGERDRVDGDLVLAEGPRREAFWTRDAWLKPVLLRFDSIPDAAETMRSLAPRWYHVPTRESRLAAELERLLPRPDLSPRRFPLDALPEPHGAWTVYDAETLLVSAVRESPFPGGEPRFAENRRAPPSRAYRKLWEAFTLSGRMPGPGDRCLDAGASPGGWTWVVASLGASVLAVDRAPLAPKVASMPGVEFREASAFSVQPRESEPFDWLLSDVICYPERLYGWVSRWLDSGKAKNLVCTIKMQGPKWDRASTRLFSSVPGSTVRHLWYNRHELTWMLIREGLRPPLASPERTSPSSS